MKPDAEERRKAIMYQIDDYHDRAGRDPDNPTFLPIAACISIGWVLAVTAFAWVIG